MGREVSRSGDPITVVGGGLGGLVAAICCAEAGADVRLLEARDELGGRARSSDGPFVANLGAHALYQGRENHRWLKARGLLGRTVVNPPSRVRFLYGGRTRITPPRQMTWALRRAFRAAPHDEPFGSWATRELGSAAAGQLSALAAVVCFHHDPGMLSARFVWERLRWVYVPPRVRHVEGGWGALVDRLGRRAEALGVEVQTGSPVSELPSSPVIVATELQEAGRLLGRPDLDWPSGRAVVLDVGLEHRRGDPSAVVDLDEGMLIERQTTRDATVAPAGHELLQCHVGIRPGERVDEAAARIEASLDAGFRGWRDREVWRRRLVMEGRTGALDPPGSTWGDRPAVDQGDGRFLVGDRVAAPGILSEVSFTSAMEAAQLAVAASRHSPAQGRPAGTAGASPRRMP